MAEFVQEAYQQIDHLASIFIVIQLGAAGFHITMTFMETSAKKVVKHKKKKEEVVE